MLKTAGSERARIIHEIAMSIVPIKTLFNSHSPLPFQQGFINLSKMRYVHTGPSPATKVVQKIVIRLLAIVAVEGIFIY